MKKFFVNGRELYIKCQSFDEALDLVMFLYEVGFSWSSHRDSAVVFERKKHAIILDAACSEYGFPIFIHAHKQDKKITYCGGSYIENTDRSISYQKFAKKMNFLAKES